MVPHDSKSDLPLVIDMNIGNYLAFFGTAAKTPEKDCFFEINQFSTALYTLLF